MLALHTWTLDTTPLADALRTAYETGWEAVEIRRVDFERAAARGEPATQVLDVVRACRLPVACVGVALGWMWADGEERKRILTVFDEQCARAVALGARLVMSPVDRGRGDVRRAATSVREVSDIAAKRGVRLGIEFNSQAEQLNTLERIREVMSAAAHPATGLLLDSYHLWRSGATLKHVEDVPAAEIAYVQFSDVPRATEPGKVLDRLPPGKGIVPFREFFAVLHGKRYAGPMSYEAPNESAWKRPAAEVAREALEAARAVLPR